MNFPIVDSFLVANTWTFLLRNICGFWPLLILGTLVGLATAWYLWYRSARERFRLATANEAHLKEAIQAFKAAAPLIAYRKAGNGALASMERKVQTMEGELKEMRKQLINKERELSAKAAAVAELTKKASATDVQLSQIQALQGNITTLEASAKDRSESLEAANKKAAAVGRDLTGAKTKLSGFEEKLKQGEKDRAAALKTIEDWKAKAKNADEDWKAKHAELEAQIEERVSDLQNVQAKVADGDEQRKALESQQGQLEAKLGDKKKELAALQDQLLTAQADAEARGQEIMGLTSNVDAFKSKAGDFEKQLHDKEQELANSRDQLGKAQSESNERNQQLGTKATELSALQDQLAATEVASKARSQEIQGLKSSMDSTSGKLDAVEAKLRKREDELATLRSDLDATQAKKNAIGQEVSGLNREIAEHKSAVQKRDKELDALRAQLTAAKHDANSRHQEVQALTSNLSTLKVKVNDRESNLKKREAALADLRKELNATQAEVKARSIEVGRLTASLESANKAMEEVRGQLGERDQKLAALAGDLKSAETEAKAKVTELNKLTASVESGNKATAKVRRQLAERDGSLAALRKTLSERERAIKGLSSDVQKASKARLRWEQRAAKKQVEVVRLKAMLAQRNEERRALRQGQSEAARAAKALGKENAALQRKLKTKVKAASPRVMPLVASSEPAPVKDKSLGLVYEKRPKEIDDLTRISGVAGVLEGKLHQFGVYRFRQVALWDEQQVREFSSRLLFQDRIARDAWVVQAAQLHYDKYGEDLRKASKSTLKSRTSSSARKTYKAMLKLDSSLGAVYSEKPETIDDLKEIRGVAGVLEGKLHQLGVYRFKQIAQWTPKQVEAFSKRLDLKGRVEREEWIAQARKLHLAKHGEDLDRGSVESKSSKATTSAKSSHRDWDAGIKQDATLGAVYSKRPSHVDDLELISGVAGVLEDKLNNLGVYQFKQVAHWTTQQVKEFSSRLSFRDRIERDHWISQAAQLHWEKYNEDLKIKGAPITRSSSKPGWKGGNGRAVVFGSDAKNVTYDNKLGFVYRSKPTKQDDLKRISGVAEVIEGKLHKSGVYRFKQIALWNKTQIDEFAKRLSFNDRIEREEWVRQAENLHLENYGEDLAPYMADLPEPEVGVRSKSDSRGIDARSARDQVRVDQHLGRVYSKRPRYVDDLKRIKGVAEVLEFKLHKIGVYRFEQIANWTPTQIEAFSLKLDFKDRIEREEWVRQARKLNDELLTRISQ